MSRLGARRGRMRDETYAELQQHVERLHQQLEELQRDNDRRLSATTIRAATATSPHEMTAAAKAVRSVADRIADAAKAAVKDAAAVTPASAGIRRSSSKQVEYHGKGLATARATSRTFPLKMPSQQASCLIRERESLCFTWQ